MGKHTVGTTKEIRPGTYKIVRVDDVEIGVFNIKGRFYAYENFCPHQGARGCLGEINETTNSSISEPILTGRTSQILRCPWHGWQFDLRTGESLIDCSIRLKPYDLRIENQKLILTL